MVHALLTSRPEITRDVRDVFAYLAGGIGSPEFHTLLVMRLTLRVSLVGRIEQEMEQARTGRLVGMVLEMNSLEDRELVEVLCRASAAGVPIWLVVRRIRCLAAGVAGASNTIEAPAILECFFPCRAAAGPRYRFASWQEDTACAIA